MTDLAESARQRAEADYEIAGDTPEIRRINAGTAIKAMRKLGRTPDQWLIDVAEGRLPA